MNATPFEHLRQTMTGYMQSSILGAAAELDVCTVLLENGNNMSAYGIAIRCSSDLRGTTVLLDAMAAMGYLAKSGTGEKAHYSVAEEYKEYLDSRSPRTAIPIIRHLACVQRGWVRLAWAVKEGEPQDGTSSILGAAQDRVSFIMGMNSIAVQLVDGTMESLRKAGILSFAKEDVRILDIGGASGTYTEAFLKELPKAEAAIFDLPVAIEQAKARFAGTALESRVKLVKGDFTVHALPDGFDFAWISAIIHQMSREESRRLYEKTLQALNPGGAVAVRDYVMGEDRITPAEGAFFGVNMLINTHNGMVYTFKEIKEDLEAAGFRDVHYAVQDPTMSAVVTARKPGN